MDAVLAIGMAKLPRHRFASARVFARAFDEASRGQLSPATRDQARSLLQVHPWSRLHYAQQAPGPGHPR